MCVCVCVCVCVRERERECVCVCVLGGGRCLLFYFIFYLFSPLFAIRACLAITLGDMNLSDHCLRWGSSFLWLLHVIVDCCYN